MSDSRYIMALGYPMGAALKESDNMEYLVELDNKIRSLNATAYRLWNFCLGGIKIPQLVDLLKMQDAELLNRYIDCLEERNLLLVLDLNKTNGFYERLSCCVGLRQGVGVGLNETNNYYVQSLELVELAVDEYIVWSQINRRSVADLAQAYRCYQNVSQNQARDRVVEIILFLVSKGLLFITEFRND